MSLLLMLQVPGGNPVIWGQKGISRFYVRRAYDRRSREFKTLPPEALEYFPPELSMPESEFREVVRPLRTLDLFSGCGGLSHGLERSGCAKVEWAIEIDPSAARSFEVTKLISLSVFIILTLICSAKPCRSFIWTHS